MDEQRILTGGGKKGPQKKCRLTAPQIETLQGIGHGLLITADGAGQPRGSIVEPSFFYKDEIVVPVVQLQRSYNNIMQNEKIFLHFVKENSEDFGWSTQYKISAIAKVESEGELFERAKHFEESERLPENLKVRAIVRAKITDIEVVEG